MVQPKKKDKKKMTEGTYDKSIVAMAMNKLKVKK